MTGTNDHTVARSLKEPVGAEPLSVLAPDGTPRRGASAPMDAHAVLDALRLMMLSRALDDRATKLNRLGKLVPTPWAGGRLRARLRHPAAPRGGTAPGHEEAAGWLTPGGGCWTPRSTSCAGPWRRGRTDPEVTNG
jgi:hypothetical protein